MNIIFTPDDSGKNRGSGYTTVGYSSDREEETLVETTESDLASIFETAKSNGETFDSSENSIDESINDPLAFLDFLILDEGTIKFDSNYVRETQT